MGKIFVEEDEEIVYRITKGDESAFDLFYERHWKFVFNAAFKRVEDREAAQDITQEVFCQFWQQHQSDKVPVIGNVRAYLYGTVRNQVFKWIDREKKYVSISETLDELLERSGEPDAAMLFDELFSTYRKVVERLSPQQRLIFNLRYEEGKTSQEIAEELKLSDKTVRNQLGRALGKVKAVFMSGWFFLVSFIW